MLKFPAKKMMMSLFGTLFLLITSNSYAQDWAPFKSDYKYNFQVDTLDFISISIWVDSISVENGDSVFYLNRIVLDCDTCNRIDYDGYLLPVDINTSQFLQRSVVITDSVYHFISPHNFAIKQKANRGDSWIFDDQNLIHAKIDSVFLENIFGQRDSVKLITLSTKDTIMLSKNFGIIRFDDVYDSCSYSLKGIEGLVGEEIPKFLDYFNFSVGDIFEYHGYSWGQTFKLDFKEKCEIISKNKVGDTIEYDVNVIYYEMYWWSEYHPPLFKKSETYNEKWKFVNYKNHPVNLYNNQLIAISDIPDYKYHYSYDYYNYSRIILGKDTTNLYTKKVGRRYPFDYFISNDTTNSLLPRFYGGANETELVFTQGLGITSTDLMGFEWSTNRQLVGYKKGDIVVGQITDDEYLLVGVENLKAPKIQVYPNPTHDIIQIKGASNEEIISLKLFSMDGGLKLQLPEGNVISLKGVKKGIYVLRIETEKGFINKKIIID